MTGRLDVSAGSIQEVSLEYVLDRFTSWLRRGAPLPGNRQRGKRWRAYTLLPIPLSVAGVPGLTLEFVELSGGAYLYRVCLRARPIGGERELREAQRRMRFGIIRVRGGEVEVTLDSLLHGEEAVMRALAELLPVRYS